MDLVATQIGYKDVIDLVNWHAAIDALRVGHQHARAEISDSFLGPQSAILLNRAAYIEGLGYGVKAVTVMGENAQKGLPTVQGAMMIYDHRTGGIRAIIESRLITEIKTASDSVLGAQLLARSNSEKLLIVGAGVVAESLVKAFSAGFPSLKQIAIWARRHEQAKMLASQFDDLSVKVLADDNLEAAVRDADIVSTATMTREPILQGRWISPGTHIDLIGAFKHDMREADDTLISMGSLYVDSRETTIGHIGELMIPIASGVINEDDIKGDLYDLMGQAQPARLSEDEVTIFKNGGGAHLDLMIGNYIAQLI